MDHRSADATSMDGGRENPGFLELPVRSSKPRQRGLTHVLDKGLPLTHLHSLLELAASHVDILKLGWGTAYVSGSIPGKVAACRSADVRISTGGTLLEIAVAQNKTREFVRWVRALGIDSVEVSNGALEMKLATKRSLIQELSREFIVLSEVGSKVGGTPVPSQWVSECLGDLEAGAAYVLIEGRESGTVGLYNKDGSVREHLVEAVLERVPQDRVIFEAPQKSQQAWFVVHLGTDVNLGNIPPDEIVALETLRLGLRADSVAMSTRTRSLALGRPGRELD